MLNIMDFLKWMAKHDWRPVNTEVVGKGESVISYYMSPAGMMWKVTATPNGPVHSIESIPKWYSNT